VIPHNKPTLNSEEAAAAERVLRSGWVAQGKEVEAFENEFCDFLHIPHGSAVAVSSGTAALYLALWSLGAKEKSVAFPAYVCSALRHATSMAGAKEVLVDVASGSPNVDIKALAKSGAAIAIVPHMYGLPVDVSELTGKMDVIEDCAQALGATMGKTAVGLNGKVGIYSFYATKLITTGGQGGMVVTKDKALADTIRDFREFDCRRDSKPRFNFQMTDLAAAIGREQLKKLPGFLKRRSEIFKMYQDAGLTLLDSNAGTPVRYRAVLRTSEQKRILDSLAKLKIKAINPLEDWELLGSPEKFPNAYKLTQETVSLPVYPSLSNEEVKAIITGALQS